MEVDRTTRAALEAPMLILSGVWLLLLVVEFTRGLSPILQTANDAIWIVFVLQFLIEVTVAPSRSVLAQKLDHGHLGMACRQ